MPPSIDSRHSGDILMIFRKQLGDLLLMQPAIQYLTEHFGVPVRVRTRPAFADLLALMPGRVTLATGVSRTISRVYCFDTKPSSIIDALISWPARRILILTRPERAWWYPVFFHEVLKVEKRGDYRARLFQQSVGARNFKPPCLNPPPINWFPEGLPESYIVVHPTSAWRRKTWPVTSWIAFLTQLQTRISCPLLITAGSEAWEKEMATSIAEGLPEQAFNLAGRTSLKGYLAVLARAQAVFTVDGSASHLASAFGRPTLTLFGPTNPAHWNWPSHLSRRLWAADFCQERKPGVGSIPVAPVLAEAIDLLGECGIV